MPERSSFPKLRSRRQRECGTDNYHPYRLMRTIAGEQHSAANELELAVFLVEGRLPAAFRKAGVAAMHPST